MLGPRRRRSSNPRLRLPFGTMAAVAVLGCCWCRRNSSTTLRGVGAAAAAAAYYQPQRWLPQRRPPHQPHHPSSHRIFHRSITGGNTVAPTVRCSISSRSTLASEEPSLEGGGEGVSFLDGAAATAATYSLPPSRPAPSSARRQPTRQDHSHDHFVTPPLQVYIEDTDAYGVMYNGNYLRAYDRALHTTTTTSTSSKGVEEPVEDDGCCGVRHIDAAWSIVSVQELKFLSPPSLGGVYCIEGIKRKMTLSDETNSSGTTTTNPSTASSSSSLSEVWDLVMRSPDGSTIYNTATGVTIARPPPTAVGLPVASNTVDSSTAWLPVPPPLGVVVAPPGGSVPSQPTMTQKHQRRPPVHDYFQTYRDEFESHLPQCLPLRNALNLMERSRTNGIGGPDALRRLQHGNDETNNSNGNSGSGGILFVVTKITACSLVGPPQQPFSANEQRIPPPNCMPGSVLRVETDFVARNTRGTIIDCYQTVFYPDGHTRQSQGIVTIVALNAATRRPTKRLPTWLSESLLGLPQQQPTSKN